ncbi:CU044_5270 family protein [Spongiactinospora sp. 9N601]|uniref:CU044_5270 family protein n=1 Tax=Spongiactinospora sp. 9N601 TaxID=3375149 RepID=UPI0037A032BB
MGKPHEDLPELHELRELYGEPPPPHPSAAARVRARLENERRRRARLPWMLAAATAVAVVVGTALPAPTATLAGRSVLLAAATAAAAVPGEPAGAYWHVSRLRSEIRQVAGHQIVTERLSEQWATEDGRHWQGDRDLGTRPRSPADEAAWRRDGSPSAWYGVALRTSPGKGDLTPVSDRAPFSIAGRDLTVAQTQRLPADPADLERRVRGMLPADAPDGLLADAMCGLLWSKPSPPGVRAAAYRVLAGLPEVRYLGETADERGRKGAGFSFTVRRSNSPVLRTLIIDPRTSQVLSSTDQGPGAEERSELVLSAGWTAKEPSPPRIPPAPSPS